MDHEGCSSGGMSAPTTYTFAFNDSNFSDRMLRIEVVAASEKNDAGGTSARQKKRRRADRTTEAGLVFCPFVCSLLRVVDLKHEF
jgi:hypothetical protein